jgi:lipoyl(octanoyl) transferase
MSANSVIIRDLKLEDYTSVWQRMQAFTSTRGEATLDEIWLVEHPPVFTQGQNGKVEHILAPSPIPVVKVDRGGQVTYHGPGQLVAYILVDLKRKKLNVRQIVTVLESSVVVLLKDAGILAETKCEAPGVYVSGKKICSVGLRIRRGATFHGLALNVDMDLSPFLLINPCGYPGLQMTQVADLVEVSSFKDIQTKLVEYLVQTLDYNQRFHE